ncbi:YoaK family protein [Actinomadura viridis]|uniref:YoaK family protein n=1 Tax=Actinomadura viridis TaxID=58110 RepID=UPI003691FC0A
MLLIITLSTGMIDTVSYLELGQVFVAAMTGNLIFLGLGLTGLGPLLAPSVSILAYAVGAACGGRVAFSRVPRRAILLAWGTASHAGLVGVAALLLTLYGFGAPWPRHAVLASLALSMGWQYAIVRRLKVPDVTTTVVTTTITTLFGEIAGPERQRRRLLMIGTLLCGVLLSGLLRRTLGPVSPLWASGGLLAVCSVLTYVAARRPGAEQWNRTLPPR